MSRKRAIYVAVGALILVVAGGALGYRLFMRSNQAAADDGIHAEGKLLPVVRRYVYYEHGIQGTIVKFDVNPGDLVPEDRTLMHLHDVALEKHLADLITRRDAANLASQRELAKSLQRQIDNIRGMMDGKQGVGPNGQAGFTVKAPRFTTEEAAMLHGQPMWTILNPTFKEELMGQDVRPSDPLLRLGAKDGPWELEMKIPHKHIGEVTLAYQHLGVDELDVEFQLRSDPSRTFQGKLHKNKVASEDSNSAEPVPAYVRIDGDDIEPAKRVPPELRVNGTELDAKVRSGMAR